MQLSINEQVFIREVLQADTPVLVHFWAPWCGLCRLIQPLLEEFRDRWHGAIDVVGINADESLKLATTYKLTNLPTLILFRGGQVVYRTDSFSGKDDLRCALADLPSRYLLPAKLSIGEPQLCAQAKEEGE